MHRTRWILALLGLAALLWILRGRDAEGPAPEEHERPPDAAPSPPLLKSRAAAPEDAGAPPRDDSEPITTPAVKVIPGSAVKAWVDVRVRCVDEDLRDSVRVYALRAGAAGAAGTYELPSAVADVNGEPVRIGVLEPGRHDIGVVADWGHKISLDVDVRAGEVMSVDLVLDAPGVVQVRLNDEWPIKGLHNVRAWVVLRAEGTQDGRPAPGRGERYHPLRACTLWTDLQGERLPEGVTYDASVKLVRPVAGTVTHVVEFEPTAAGLHLEPVRVTSGDRIQLSLPALIEVPLGLRPAGAWPAHVVTTLTVEVYGRGWVSRHDWYRELSASSLRMKGDPAIRALAVDEGALHVRWRGSMLKPGELLHVERRLQKGIPIELPLVLDPARVREPLTVNLDVLRPPARIYMTAWGSDAEPPMRHRAIAPAASKQLPGQWREYARLLAYTNDGRISEPTLIPQRGSLALRWLEGGYLRIAGAVAYPDEAGALVLRRLDGRPFIEGERSVVESFIEDDDRLGPFRPGPVEFELRAGRRLLRTYRAVIRPGEERRLRIR